MDERGIGDGAMDARHDKCRILSVLAECHVPALEMTLYDLSRGQHAETTDPYGVWVSRHQ